MLQMVQQTKDSTFSKYGLSHPESGLSNCDKQLSVSITANEVALRDSDEENSMSVSEPKASLPLVGDTGCAGETNEASGVRKPDPTKNNTGSGHIVYVRRKAETEVAKRNVSEAQSRDVDCLRSNNSPYLGETPDEQVKMNDPMICISEVSPFQRASSPSLSSTRCPITPLVTSSDITSTENLNNTHVKCPNLPSDNQETVNVNLREERYCRWRNLMAMLDQSDQTDYTQMLRSLSSVELSRHAIELEKRSIKLSLEEAKELQRVRILDVLDKYPKNGGGTGTIFS